MPSVAIVAGEASGDVSGGALARELRRLQPDISIWGAGGPAMRSSGVELVADFSWAGAIGIIESLKLAPRLFFELANLKKEFVRRRPDVFIPIDFGAFNVKLSSFARIQGIPSIYYFPPGSWRRKPRDYSKLSAASDRIITPFPWSETILREAGIDATFLGHPLLDHVSPGLTRSEFAGRLNGISEPSQVGRIVGLLPGSRSHEIHHILPVMLDACSIILEQVSSADTFVVAAGSDRAYREIDKVIKHWRSQAGENNIVQKIIVVRGLTYDVMAHSDLLLTCSGTATLEAMILGTPMIIVYRGSKWMKVEYLLRKGILEDFIGMPNIVAGREVCPELLGDQASPEAIAKLAVKWLERQEELQKVRQELNSVRAVLGEPGGTARAAQMVLRTMGLSRTE